MEQKTLSVRHIRVHIERPPRFTEGGAEASRP
jgi:hypothetical protein